MKQPPGGAHGFGDAPLHWPLTQCSPIVQKRLSLHEPFSFVGTETQKPVWHWPTVHGLFSPSSQEPPSLLGCARQPPSASQTPFVH
jgi:hypothetical protein